MNRRVMQEEADQAAAEAASWWPSLASQWPWTREASLAPVYRRIGELTVALLRAFPAIQWSNQARWYQRSVRDTPSILVFPREAFEAEVRNLAGRGVPPDLAGKIAVTLVYPVDTAEPGSPDAVAKTLIASTDATSPQGLPFLAHEVLSCFCDTDWDGHTLRAGLRQTTWNAVGATQVEHLAALYDFTLDATLVHFLPAVGVETDALFSGALGPYWQLVRTFTQRLRGVPTLPALFAPHHADMNPLERFERGLAVALDTPDAATTIDQLVATHDWSALGTLLGADA